MEKKGSVLKKCLVGVFSLLSITVFNNSTVEAEVVYQDQMNETQESRIEESGGKSVIGESVSIENSESDSEKADRATSRVAVADLSIQGTKKFDFAYRVLELMNAERKKNGLSALAMDQTLQEAAMERSAEINVDFSHNRPNGEGFSMILKKYNYATNYYLGENIAAGYIDPEAVFTGWMNSPGHKGNMLSPNYKTVGIGSFTQGGIMFWTQIFSSKQVADFKRTDNQKVSYAISTDVSNKLILNYRSPWTMDVGDSNQFFLSILNRGWTGTVAKISNESTNWTVSNASIATINSDGLLTAKKSGTTTLNGTIKTNPNWSVNHDITVKNKIAPPTLTVNDVTKTAGDSFDPMKDVLFDAVDYNGVNLKAKVIVTANNVNIKKVGIYQVTYSVTDSGNRTTTKSIKVNLVAPKPELQVKNVSIVAGTSFDPKVAIVSATDKLDGDLKTKVTASIFNVSKAGQYEVTYTVKNTSNVSTSKKAMVTVVADAPVLNVKNITIPLNSKFNFKEAIISASDKVDGDLTDRVGIKKNTVDTTKVGAYQVEYIVTNSNLKTTTKIVTVTVIESKASVSYQTHIQSQGWQESKLDGQMSGTKGKSLRLEAIKIKLLNQPVPGDIVYSTHVQNIGWQTEVKNNGMSGTSGKGYRLEAIKVNLTGKLSEQYDIYYRVHAQNVGWLDWAKNGVMAGTEGFSYRLEGIEIRLVEKGQAAPGPISNPSKLNTRIMYSTHVQNIGWQNYVSNGQTAGTSGKSYRLEGLKIKLKNTPYSGSIEYSTHIQNKGWQGFVSNDQLSGTSGEKLRLEATKIRLTGQMAKEYDVYYRVHAQEFGWLGWAKNGEPAGTAKYGYRLEAIQIQLVKRGESFPVSNIAAFKQK
ncbi:hypothetical protein UAY_01258 [Enterococcus moraviensis ATCC BAA-383]|uniref:SCP domain-containing protein n=1 Tax=Enterococcus moraviensis ATCC BAA-383 TaxID=1158609 RepID=R2QZ74_9ENTE|nr:immunoglobulin-like domain-containing protein [Enterococcus moraviensis]EOI01850.1 hypothetical protein UAY_01258 [Enterococcus moraviensis ATCC BAA-383]EOT73615.1 hypothetical protein I586_00609 [Enterococcus moraviensis ATCC BAA-383]OJG69175.1 hypothetical protein RV09_GL000574 [Enterococcus moraviensis]